MHQFATTAALQRYLNQWRAEMPHANGTVGFVPTMGALHAGHVSLLKQAKRENALVVASIFVNPLQFGPAEDFQVYPRDRERDRTLCEEAGVDVLFVPEVSELGIPANADAANTDPLTQIVPPPAMTKHLCGRSRQGHFQGVATIVTKLLNLVQPDRAYFGRKDAQQLAILQRVVADLNLPVEIVPCPTVREANGLACSSRNQGLTPEQRDTAALLYRSLQKGAAAFQAGERKNTILIAAVTQSLALEPKLIPEYVELVDPQTLQPITELEDAGLLAAAVRLGGTRLIDNIQLRDRKPIVAIDGPAGAGKSTVTRQLANQLGLLFLDTGAMYRAVTWLVLEQGIDPGDEPAIAKLVSQCQIQLEVDQGDFHITINGTDVTKAIRTPEVTAKVSAIAAQAAVREALVRQQQRYGTQGGVIAEGRDIGTHVFPDAELKIFLTASPRERARRRQQDLIQQGQEAASLDELEHSIRDRDEQDSTRRIAPLRQAADAIELQTDDLTIEQVINQIAQLYRDRALLPK